MKPIKLIISAFGPYAGLMPEINFEQFEGKSLFLITGDTGAGKTTIFDAICYALYGEASGSHRDTKNFRSDYASVEKESYVDFYFSHQGKNYHIKRNPQYLREKKRGSGTKEKKEDANLYCENGLVISGVKAATDAVRKLLNLDVKQFKQIAMIAQGEFWNLLNASTEDRTVILRNIFMTNAYKYMGELLLERENQVKNELKELNESISQYFNDAKVDEQSEFAEDISIIKTQNAKKIANLSEIIEILNKIIDKDKADKKIFDNELKQEEKQYDIKNQELATAKINNDFIAKLQKLEAEKLKLNEEKTEMNLLENNLLKQKDACHIIKPVYDAFNSKKLETENLTKQLKDLKEKFVKADEEKNNLELVFNEALSHESESKELLTKIALMKKDEDKYEKRDNYKNELLNCESKEKELEAKVLSLADMEEELKEKINNLKERKDSLMDAKENSIKFESELEKCKNLKDRINSIINSDIPKYNEDCNELKKSQNAFLKIQDRCSEKIKLRDEAEKLFERYRAGIMAKDLKEGEACPVCGSLNHPKLAILPNECIEEEKIRILKEEEDKAIREKEVALKKLEKEKGIVENSEINLKNIIVELILNNTDSLNEIHDKTNININSNDKSDRKLNDLIKELEIKSNLTIKDEKYLNDKCIKEKEIINEFNKVSKDLDFALGKETEELKENRKILEIKLNENKTKISEITGALGQLVNLEFDCLSKAVKERKAVEKKAENLIEAIESSRKNRDESVKKLASLASSIGITEGNLSNQKLNLSKLADNLKEILKDKGFESETDFLDNLISEKKLSDNEKVLNDYKAKLKTNEEMIKSAKEDAKGRSLIDIAGLEKKVKEQDLKVRNIRENKNEIEHRIKINEEKYLNINNLKDSFENNQKEYSICDRLYKLVSGQVGKEGSGRISLEQYIQASGFDNIIKAANRRLSPMSDGQFELYRNSDLLGRKSNTFLNLVVMDNYTGKKRPVSSLSGGESFKASLSLALGLSDTVSSSLGGIQMDALFIDEGFGTLDRKSIESAMDILTNLSASNKLVGIISHREELKENIVQQLRIKKDKTGSHIEVDLGI